MIFAECNNSLLTHVAKHNSLILFVRGHP